MQKLTSLLIAISLFTAIQSQTVIAVQHGSTTTLETRLDSAIEHAQSGDVIYLPGGMISSSNVEVSKKLSIIGAGYHPDSSKATSPTIITATLYFNTGSEGSLITGISLNGAMVINCINTTISRCNIGNIYISNNNALIEENIVRGVISENNTNPPSFSNVIIRKNIIYAAPIYLQSVTFSNNIILDGQNSSGTGSFYQVINCYFINNIITSGFDYGNFGSTFNNNLFTSNFTSSSTDNNNINNEPIANIFMNYTPGSSWKSSENFHLKAGSKGIGLGTDSYDAGIYGSSSPFKDGGVPFNPHYQNITIPTSTSSNGMLNVNITVKAQDH